MYINVRLSHSVLLQVFAESNHNPPHNQVTTPAASLLDRLAQSTQVRHSESTVTSPPTDTPTPQPVAPANITQVLLYTYYRGGSSFLGDVFNNNPDVFYWFEPLAGITDNWGKDVWTKDPKLTRDWHINRDGSLK